MTPWGYTLWTSVHGMLAGLAWVLLLHPIVFLRRGGPARRAAQRTAVAAAALLSAVFALGSWVYPTYRGEVKPLLVHTDAAAWVWFERKEHLAVLALAAAFVGAAWLVVVPERPAWGRRLLLVSWMLVTGVVGLGLGVGAAVHPGWAPAAEAR
jgi:hypothetical protein